MTKNFLSTKVWKGMVKTIKQFINKNGMTTMNVYYYSDYGYITERVFPMFGEVTLFEINDGKLHFWNYEKDEYHIVTLEQLDFKCLLILCEVLEDILVACKSNNLPIVKTDDFM